jgi:hypothetical protein
MLSAVSSKIYTVKKYFLFLYHIFYFIVFLDFLCSSYSIFILYINYHPYFTIFLTTNLFSLIPTSTTIIFIVTKQTLSVLGLSRLSRKGDSISDGGTVGSPQPLAVVQAQEADGSHGVAVRCLSRF